MMMFKRAIQKINTLAAFAILAVASIVAAPATELCTIIMLDDVEIPYSLLKKE